MPTNNEKINFQLEDAIIPEGYLADVGLGYDETRGYGWITQESLGEDNPTPLDLSGVARERELNEDQRLDTLVHMQFGTGNPEPGAWEYAIDNGTYQVTVGVGDPSIIDSTHQINIEGVETIAAFEPTTTEKFATATSTVEVSDGKLTVDAVGGENTKIDYIEFAPVSDLVAQINFQPEEAETPEGYVADSGEKYDEERGYGWIREDSLGEEDPTPWNRSDLGRERERASDQRVDTFINMQYPDRVAGAWEYAIDNGSYEVTVGVGDPSFSNGVYQINVEGVETIAAFEPSNAQRLATATSTVEVTDGKLTVDAVGGENTKIDYIQIAAVDNLEAKINFQPEEAETPEGYVADSGGKYDEEQGYGWIREDSLSEEDPTPWNRSDLGRERERASDQRVDTFINMQYPDRVAGAWEYALPDGTYSVTVSVGDPLRNDSVHQINVEGVALIDSFTPDETEAFELATTTVEVNDGKLTLDAVGGSNTKLNYIEIESLAPGDRPEVTGNEIAKDSTGKVLLDSSINANISVAVAGEGVDPATLTTNNVVLYRTEDNSIVPGSLNTSGGNDVIVYQPSVDLEPNTNYTFRVTSGVEDTAGNAFEPYSTTFNTGEDTKSSSTPGVEFTKTVVYQGAPLASLFIDPQGKLYAAGLDGKLRRWDIDSNGELSNEQTFADPDGQLEGRAIVGISLDPDNERDLWVTHNAPLPNSSNEGPAPDFSGKVSKITLADSSDSFEGEVEDYIVNLPRSVRDHLTNSLIFGPDEDPSDEVKRYIYIHQGSNSAMGAPDAAWGLRPERLLGGAVLKIDPDLTPPEGGFNVQTEDYLDSQGNLLSSGDYNPNDPDAPLTIFAEGIRNAYDLVWHSNGNLYIPANGSAAGGNTPDNPDTPEDEALSNVGTQDDYLFKIAPEGGGYYGHPNPLRNDYILNGGNPTSEVDPAEIVAEGIYAGYEVGTQPESDYQGFAYDFGTNRSPNGSIEYQSTTSEFGDALKNQLLVVEYSGGKDLLALNINEDGDVDPGSATQVASELKSPIDVIEDTFINPGNLYVAELPTEPDGGALDLLGQITLLEPTVSAT